MVKVDAFEKVKRKGLCRSFGTAPFAMLGWAYFFAIP